MGKRFAGIWRQNAGIKFSSIRVNKLPYVLAYFFELVLFAFLNRYYRGNAKILMFSEWKFAQAMHMIASLVIILLWNKKFKKLIYISLAVFVAGLVPCVFLTSGNTVQIIAFVVTMVGLGGIASCARCGFAFGTNNSEKAFGLLFAFFADKAIRIMSAYEVNGAFVLRVLPLLLLAGMTVSSLLFKEDDLSYVENSSKNDAKGLYWALAYYIVYFMIDGKWSSYGTCLNNGKMIIALIGTLVGITVLFLCLFVFRLNSYHAWNIFFLGAAIAFLANALAPVADTADTCYFFENFSKMGWLLALFFLACAQKRFASIRLLKISTVVYVILSPLSKYSDTILKALFKDGYDIAIAVYLILIILIFLMLLPYSYRYLFSNEWISQMSKPDMEIISENVEEVDEFEKWNLSPRQKEVATLLLAGKTRRQISGELKLSESTVKLHTSELYKKLNINSRVELFRIFGAKVNSDDESVPNETDEKDGSVQE